MCVGVSVSVYVSMCLCVYVSMFFSGGKEEDMTLATHGRDGHDHALLRFSEGVGG